MSTPPKDPVAVARGRVAYYAKVGETSNLAAAKRQLVLLNLAKQVERSRDALGDEHTDRLLAVLSDGA